MITSVTYARLWNLGNYENEKLEATVSVGSDDASDVTTAFVIAQATVEAEHRRMMDNRRAPAPAPVPASDKQRNYIATLQDQLGWHGEQLAVYADEQKVDLVAMTVDQASRLINGMKRLATERSGAEDIPF